MTMDMDEGDLLNSSLTNLQWLQHINMNLNEGLGVPRRTIASSTASSSSTSPVKEDRQPGTQRASSTTPRTGSTTQRAGSNAPRSGPCSTTNRPNGVDYTRNAHIKPPYSYATLICMAIRETAKHKITLSAIYNWIMANFAYYRNADPSWQNSIRHNLSLNKCFVKVPRDKDEPGKGGFWMINSEYEEYFKNGVFKRRKSKKKLQKAPYTKSGAYAKSGIYRSMNVYNPSKLRTKPQTIEVCNGNIGLNNNVIRLASSLNFNCSSNDRPYSSSPQRPSVKLSLNSHHSRPSINLSNSLNRPSLNLSNSLNRPSLNLSNSLNRPSLNLSNSLNRPSLNLSNSFSRSSINLNNSFSKSTTSSLNNSILNVEEQPWDLVLKDIQLNSACQGSEITKRTDQEDFFKDPSLNFDNLQEDLTSPELNELVRDIESLIDGPTLREPELFVKGEKMSAASVMGCGQDDSYSTTTTWNNIMEELNLGGITDYLDSPLNGLV